MNLWQTEPTLVLNAIKALLALGVAWGVSAGKITAAEGAGITTAVIGVLAWVNRSHVTPA